MTHQYGKMELVCRYIKEVLVPEYKINLARLDGGDEVHVPAAVSVSMTAALMDGAREKVRICIH
jgi:hypothetical protein